MTSPTRHPSRQHHNGKIPFPKHKPLVEKFVGDAKVFVAGSSWQPDEEIFIPYFANRPGWKLVIAPHVIGEDHLSQIEQMLRDNGRKAVRYTTIDKGQAADAAMPADADTLIIDCFGLLSSIYRYADVTYVGGGFGVGIHNLLEAAVWEKPVVFGPNNARFQEAQDLKASQGGWEISDSDSFKTVMDNLTTNRQAYNMSANAAGEYVKQKAGATDAVLKMLNL